MINLLIYSEKYLTILSPPLTSLRIFASVFGCRPLGFRRTRCKIARHVLYNVAFLHPKNLCMVALTVEVEPLIL